VVGAILGPIAETHFRRAMQISQGDETVFFTRPLSASILAVALLLFLGPRIWTWVQRNRAAGTGEHPA